jgi:hypothetical protein
MRPRKCVSAFAKSTEFTCTSEFAPNMASLHVSRVGVLGPGVRSESCDSSQLALLLPHSGIAILQLG